MVLYWLENIIGLKMYVKEYFFHANLDGFVNMFEILFSS